MISRAAVPVIVQVARRVRLDVTLVPRAGTQISDVYIGIGGPGSWGNRGPAPSGHYLTLLHEDEPFTGERHFTTRWTVQPDQVGTVQLSVLYTATDSTGPELIESWPVGFQVRG